MITELNVCSKCGANVYLRKFFSQSPVAKQMRLHTLCFDCAFWKDYKENPQPDTYIVSHKLYVLKDIQYITYQRNKMPRKFVFFLHDMQTGQLAFSFSGRLIANIPQRFWSEFPDRYRFISYDTYQRMEKRICKECLAKGCWDRYYCYWYNKDKAEGSKPWNEIPDYHKPGDEECESFINKETMYDNIELPR